jgi:hypothetical protein
MMRRNSLLSRVCALALLVSALTVLWFGMVAPLWSALAGTTDSEREKSLNLLARYEEIIAQKGSLEIRLKTLGTAGDDQNGLIAGPTSAVAAASLQGELRSIIEGVGGEIRSAQILPAEKIEDFEKIAIQYELNIPSAALQRLLQGLETHRIVLVLDVLRLRVPETVRSADPAAAEAKINGQWTIAGFRRIESNAR